MPARPTASSTSPGIASGGRWSWRRATQTLMLAATLIAAVTLPGRAVEFDEILADKALEARARAISTGLRCLVCQNQSIDDSNAPLARDLRILVRERLQAGDSDAEVRAFLVARYGDFVLLRPPVTATTFLLWGGPFLILIGGGVAIALAVGRRRKAVPAAPLSDDEKARLDIALGRD